MERHPLWKIPIGCLILFLLMGVFGSVVITAVVTSFRSSDVYKQAIASATESVQVREQVGEPIKAAWFITGQLNVNGSTGNANLAIPISGPKGKGLIRAVARKNGVWKFTCLEVDIQGQPGKVDLLLVQTPERNF